MKKLTLLASCLLIALLLPGLASARNIYVQKMFDAEVFASSTAEYSKDKAGDAVVIDLNQFDGEGYFAVQVYLNDADGSMTLEWEGSNDGTNYVAAYDDNGNAWSNICTSFAFGGGPATNGRAVFTVQPPPCRYLRIKATPSAHAITGLTVIVSHVSGN
jgi:hypothetical protein